MNINLELYKTFYYVAKNESISRAANELLISQPAISKAIKTLEDQLNTNLFIRKRDGVELTEAGETIYKKIKDAMDFIGSAESDLKTLTNMESGTINIGASKTIIHEFLMPYIKSFHKAHPNINIKIHTDKPSDIIKKATMGRIDVIFTNLPYTLPQEFNEFKLIDLHDCFIANEDFSEYKNKKLTIKDLENLPLLVLTKGTATRIRLDNFCEENNIHIKPAMEFSSNTLIKEFTEEGFGIGLLNEEHIKEELQSGKLFKLDINLTLKEKYLGMVYNKENKSLIDKNFIKYIKDSIKN